MGRLLGVGFASPRVSWPTAPNYGREEAAFLNDP